MTTKDSRRQAPGVHRRQPCSHRRLVTTRPANDDGESPQLVCRECGVVLPPDAPLEDPSAP